MTGVELEQPPLRRLMPSLLGPRRPPTGLLAAGLFVGAAVLLPAAYLVIVATGDLGHDGNVPFQAQQRRERPAHHCLIFRQ